jgi:HPt (histidine-containing phosphotransfer) domain-containing protein
MSNELPIIDIPEALNRAMGDVSFLQMMIDEFQHMIPDFMTRIEQAVQLKDLDMLGKDAHQFKGTAANLGAKTIAAAALELEQIGRSGNPDNIGAALADLQQAVKNFNQHLLQIEWSCVTVD